MPVEWPRFSGLCWNGYNATLSLGGVSGPLIPLDDQIGRKESWGEATMSRRADE